MDTSGQEPLDPASAGQLRRKAEQRLCAKTTQPVEETMQSNAEALRESAERYRARWRGPT